MPVAESLQGKRRTHAGPKRSCRRAKARRNAGVGSSGFKMASASWRWSSTDSRTISDSSMKRQAASLHKRMIGFARDSGPL
jgi:hypothetical protein